MSWSGNRPSRGLAFPRPFVVVKWTIYLVAPAALWAAHNYRTLEDYFDTRGDMRRNRAEVAGLEQEHAHLLAEKRKLELGSGFATEKAIRERLMMVRPGENVIFLEQEAPGSASPGIGDSESDSDVSPASSSAATSAGGIELDHELLPTREENEDGLDLELDADALGSDAGALGSGAEAFHAESFDAGADSFDTESSPPEVEDEPLSLDSDPG